jgi:sugar O-acyltransferase (sialic acid O-acetyltransferase NeuD family)
VDVVIFGVGSPLVVDLEEGLRRGEVSVAAAVANVPGEVHLIDRSPLIDRDEVTPKIAKLPLLVPLFSPRNRHLAVEDAARLGFTTSFRFTDPTVEVPQSLSAEPGLWVNTGATLGAASRFGRFVLINRGASVGHHAELGEFSSVGPNATLAGQVRLGVGATVGAGAVVLPEVTVGDHATVGAGAVVTRDVPKRTLVVGSPARVVREGLAGFDVEALPSL